MATRLSMFERVAYLLGGIWVALTFGVGGTFFLGLTIFSMKYGVPYSGGQLGLAEALPALAFGVGLLAVAAIAAWMSYRAVAKPVFGKRHD